MGPGDSEILLVGTILLASVISMSAVTYDRLTAIVLPTETRIDKMKSKIVICSTWIIALILSAPLAIFREYRVNYYKKLVYFWTCTYSGPEMINLAF